jgi:hypothetical protein
VLSGGAGSIDMLLIVGGLLIAMVGLTRLLGRGAGRNSGT